MTDDLLAFRDRFPILRDSVYLISNSLGAMPAEADDALREYAHTWATRGVRAWAEGWWDLALTTGELLRPVIGSDDVSFHQNVTLATAIFCSALDLRHKRVVTTSMEFPSVLYLLDGLDCELVVVGSRDGIGIDEEDICEAIDERTALVVLSHVLFKTSYVMDVARVADHARAAGALTLLDVFQSAGCLPMNLHALGVDAAVGGCLKWLCGGPGAGFLWVHPALDLAPRLTGWQAHRRPFAFLPPPVDRREGAARFLTGTPNIPALYAAAPGLRIVGEVGTHAIRTKSVRQTTRLIELANERGFAVSASADLQRRAGTVAVDVPHGVEVASELNARDVCVDFRPDVGIRLSPHFYTSDDELDEAFAQIDDILRTEAWQRHEGVQRMVT